MAKATKIIPEEPDVVLHLSYKEAQVLLDISRLIGGSGATRRGLVDEIANALLAVGVQRTDSKDIDKNNSDRGTIYFR